MRVTFFPLVVLLLSVVWASSSSSSNNNNNNNDSNNTNNEVGNGTAVVYGYATPFALGNAISGAKVRCLEMPELELTTDQQGYFNFSAPIGQKLTCTLEHFLFKTTQQATVTVPPEGLPYGPRTQLVFQTPTSIVFGALELALLDVDHLDQNFCHFVVTVCGYQMSLANHPQGEPGAVVTIDPPVNTTIYYFGIDKNNRTDPFTRGLTSTSRDGGVVLFNIPLSEQPYTVRASKNGTKFSESVMLCNEKDKFVNAGPPQGPNRLTPP